MWDCRETGTSDNPKFNNAVRASERITEVGRRAGQGFCREYSDLMIRFAKSQISPIGLDLGHDSVKMVQLERVGEELSVLAAARAPLPPELRANPQHRLPAAMDAIRNLLKRRGPFRGRHVVAAVPRDVLHTRNLRIAPTAADDLLTAVKAEVGNTLPFPWDDAVTGCFAAGEVRQGGEVRQEVVLLAARRSGIDACTDMLHGAGAIISALDAEPLALYRTIERFIRRRDDRRDVHVLIDIGYDRTHVVIGRGWDVQFIKPIALAGREFQEAVGRKLGITLDEAQSLRRRLNGPADPAAERDPVRQAATDATRRVMEDLAREIAMCLRYQSVTFRGQRPTVARLYGGESTDPQLLAILNRALPIPAQTGRPLYSIDTSRMPADERRGPMSEWALAFGLALKGVPERFGPRDGKPRDAAVPGQLEGPLAPAATAPTQPEVVHA